MISDDEFVAIWNASSSRHEVASKASMSIGNVNNMVHRLRKTRGDIKNMPRKKICRQKGTRKVASGDSIGWRPSDLMWG